MHCSLVCALCIVGLLELLLFVFFFFKQKTAYEMRISDWSSDVCSSDLQVTVDGGFNADALSEVASVGFTTSDKQTHVGYVVGGGVEALLIENLSAKIEYLYYDLGEEKYKGSFGGVPVSVSGELDGHIVRAGLNYGF